MDTNGSVYRLRTELVFSREAELFHAGARRADARLVFTERNGGNEQLMH